MGAGTAGSHATAIAHPVPLLLACGIRPLIQHTSPWGTRGVTGARVALAVRLSGLPLPLPPAATSPAGSPLLRPARFLALPSTSLPASQAAVANATQTRGDSSGTRVMAGCSPAGSSGVVVSGERRWWWRRLSLTLRLHGAPPSLVRPHRWARSAGRRSTEAAVEAPIPRLTPPPCGQARGHSGRRASSPKGGRSRAIEPPA